MKKYLLIIPFILIPFTVGANVINDSSLVGWWTMDGKNVNWSTGVAADSSDSGNKGQLIGMSTSTSPDPGKIGQSLLFDGVGSYVDLKTPASLTNLGPLTYAMWVYPTSLVGNNVFLLDKNKKELYRNGNTILFLVSDFGAQNLSLNCGATVLKPNVWQHLTLTWNGIVGTSSSAIMYVNASSTVCVFTPGSGAIASDSGVNQSIGGPSSTIGGSGYFAGSLDDVRIYNRVLSATEIRQLYNLGKVTANQTNINVLGATSTPAVTPNTGLAAWWTFDGKNMNWATNRATDTSGQTNDGNTTNMSTTTSPISGIKGQALRFLGQQNISVPGNSRINIPLPYTWSIWIKTSQTTGASIFCRPIIGAWNYCLSMNDSGGNLRATIGSAGFNMTTATINDNKWHHAVLTVTSGGAGQWYIDGVAKDSFTGASMTSSDVLGALCIGSNQTSGTETTCDKTSLSYVGLMDDLRLYSRALSATEVKQLYNSGMAVINQTNINVLGSTSTPSFSPNSGLVGWWTFDGKNINWTTGKASDSSFNGNDGQLISMSTSTSPVQGKVGQALKFNGSTSYVNVGDIAPLDVAYSNFTASAWVYLSNTPSGNQPIAIKMGITGQRGWQFLVTTNNRAYFDYFDGPSGSEHAIITANNALTLGKWNLVTFTFQGSTAEMIYVNGVQSIQQTSGVLAVVNGSNSASQQIGGGDFGIYLKGSIDDVRIYNRTLSATEIQQLYASGLTMINNNN